MGEISNGISAVMIVKNGERYLSVVLRALHRVADEVIVVDTGSTDATRDIAREQDCRLFDFVWCDDFAKAKNFGIEQARYSWILSVDADEVPYGADVRTILEGAMADAAIPAYVIWQDNIFDSGRVDPVKVLRFFRNDPRIRFTNPVHESIGEALYAHWPGVVPPVLDVRLRHYGYLAANSGGKHERNLKLLREWVEAEPTNIYANYKLGGTLLEMGRRGEALTFLAQTFQLFAASGERTSYPFLEAFITTYVDALIEEGRESEARVCKETAAGWF